jgi:endonuclease YncB( thermonuclease family)
MATRSPFWTPAASSAASGWPRSTRPRSGQPFGQRSKQSLSDLCYGRDAVIEDGGRDRYGRTIGRVSCAGIDANAEQVRRGMAWVFDRYATDRSLYAIQDEARAARRGLWRDPQPVPPWEYRAKNSKCTVLMLKQCIASG